jgi:hypothetical protein
MSESLESDSSSRKMASLTRAFTNLRNVAGSLAAIAIETW